MHLHINPGPDNNSGTFRPVPDVLNERRRRVIFEYFTDDARGLRSGRDFYTVFLFCFFFIFPFSGGQNNIIYDTRDRIASVRGPLEFFITARRRRTWQTRTVRPSRNRGGGALRKRSGCENRNLLFFFFLVGRPTDDGTRASGGPYIFRPTAVLCYVYGRVR